MASTKKYWRGFDELNENSEITNDLHKEFKQDIPVDKIANADESYDAKTTRRDFLKFVGFSTAAATLAACEGPVTKSVPYVVKPEEVTPGIASYYATTLMDGYDFCSVLVKTREGRPILVTPNKEVPYFGSPNARAQASVLSLYDSSRYKEPTLNGKETDWKTLDAKVIASIAEAKASGKKVALVTPSLPSPTAKKLIAEFGGEHVVFDAVSYSNALDAYEEVLGYRAFPFHDFSKAKLTVGFNADFIADWLGGGYEDDYAKSRKASKYMGRHIQIESNLTQTGANADKRLPLKSSDVEKVLAALYGELSGTSVAVKAPIAKVAKSLAKELKVAGSNALVVADGSKEAYQIALAINGLLGSICVNTSKKVFLKESNQTKWNQFVTDVKVGNIGTAIFYNVDPVFNSTLTDKDLKKIKFTVAAVNTSSNQSAQYTNAIAPTNHYLESWGDAMPVSGFYALMQPTIKTLFNTRQFEQSLLTWIGHLGVMDYYNYLKTNWKANILTLSGADWGSVVHDGFVKVADSAAQTLSISLPADALSKVVNKKAGAFELTLYTKAGMGDGQQYNNAWLQELPDPITRTSWDNYVTISAADAKELNVENRNVSNGGLNGSFVDVTLGKETLTLPAYIQPGQAKGSIGIALGYGRPGKIAEANKLDKIGVNAYPLYKDGQTNQNVTVALNSGAGEHEFACMQLHHTLMGRDEEILKHVDFDTFLHGDPHKWNHRHEFATHEGKKTADKVDLWAAHDRSVGHHFNLSIDLNLCTGCAACVIACQAENNTPVVGKEEIRVSRDMYWLRIDRYYSSDMDKEVAEEKGYEGLSGVIDMYLEMEVPSENPDVYFQPMMCQHCNHAPCETVCPVAATSHGKEGQNQMIYNRCVGTRYCLNNCPYKVRRFNWFKYSSSPRFQFYMNEDLGKMVLNPDVAVRSRGVMEKCSMCIQKTQAVKLKAKRENREVRPDEFSCACSDACTTGAMVFGDINNKESQIYAETKDVRNYHVLDALGVRPNVFYKTKVENKVVTKHV